MLQTRYEHATDVLRTRYGHATDTLGTCYRHTRDMLGICYRHATDMLGTHYGHTMDTLRAHYGHATDMVQTRYRHASDTRGTRYGHRPSSDRAPLTPMADNTAEDKRLSVILEQSRDLYGCNRLHSAHLLRAAARHNLISCFVWTGDRGERERAFCPALAQQTWVSSST